MPAPPLSRSAVADWNRLTFAGLLGGIVGVGLLVQVFLLVRTTTWTVELQRLLALAPVIVGTLIYARRRPLADIWETIAVAVWGFFAQGIADLVWFAVGPAVAGRISISTALFSGGAEFRAAALLRFLGTVAVFAALYTTAASRYDRPAARTVALLVVPIAMLVVYAVV